MDPGLFDVDDPSSGEVTAPVVRAKSICARCDWRMECFEYQWAFEGGGEDDQSRNLVFGGTTPRERTAIASSGLDPSQAAAELFEIQRRTYLLDIQLERRTDAS